ncbi:MAG: TIGR02757 family protein [Flavobacteriaceae bacterium]|nr:TIGR02757 family protein [Flavobacteriaceae bacterium]|tara:strand:+ start:1930 stop:2703 length:774 start_codon:yes stop_codon:yes gene_type:complete
MAAGLTNYELKDFLDEKSFKYNQINFIDSDPIQVPHQFKIKQDIEISSFLTSVIAWGQRKTIINNGFKMMEILDNSPYDFILNSTEKEIEKTNIIHRTFNSIDFRFFLKTLKRIYQEYDDLESVFLPKKNELNMHSSIHNFKKIFFQNNFPKRTTKHISDPYKGSACKRINMFLRWMVRKDNNGVDFGIWKKISPSILSCPLDIHSGNVARKLDLLSRKQNDHKAVLELDDRLRKLNIKDPVKYDFALFGLGVFEGF